MSKKINKGFTLAEILITLGIIGVVAALTAPALIQNAGNAKIGPTLQKVKSTIENANEQILYENDVSSLSAAAANVAEYIALLSEYISGSSYNTTSQTLESVFDPEATFYDSGWNQDYYGSTGFFTFDFSSSILILLNAYSTAVLKNSGYSSQGSFKGYYTDIIVDINGSETGPNTWGKDLFIFIMDKNGLLIPYSGKTFQWLIGGSGYAGSASYCYNVDGVKSVSSGYGCAGSIFDNNLKVIYQ